MDAAPTLTPEARYALALSCDVDDAARLVDDPQLGRAARSVADAVEAAMARRALMVCYERLSDLLPDEADLGKVANVVDKLVRRLSGGADETAGATGGASFRIILPDGARVLLENTGNTPSGEGAAGAINRLGAGPLVIDVTPGADMGQDRAPDTVPALPVPGTGDGDAAEMTETAEAFAEAALAELRGAGELDPLGVLGGRRP
jgi:hypothetical protein